MTTTPSRDWAAILTEGASLVGGYGYRITLRQLHYLLVSSGVGGYLNDETSYKGLSSRTAEARRRGTFPALLDQTREIHRLPFWKDPKEAMLAITQQYRADRTIGQDWLIVLGGEKATLLAQLRAWFDERHFPVVLVRGYGSQTYVDEVADYVRSDKEAQEREAVLIYAGDLDPSGEDILRDFLDRCPVFDKVEHIAVTESQIAGLGLTVNQGKGDDSRANQFRVSYPRLARFADDQVAAGLWSAQYSKATRTRPRLRLPNVVQVEVEALPPATLQTLYDDAINAYWDESVYDDAIEAEEVERQSLRDVRRDNFGEDPDDFDD